MPGQIGYMPCPLGSLHSHLRGSFFFFFFNLHNSCFDLFVDYTVVDISSPSNLNSGIGLRIPPGSSQCLLLTTAGRSAQVSYGLLGSDRDMLAISIFLFSGGTQVCSHHSAV